jgi:hypothetical protein
MNTPSKEFSTRLATAKQWRLAVEQEIKDALMFCAPGRERDFTRNGHATKEPVTENYSSIGERLTMDAAGDIVTYFTPETTRWYEYQVLAEVPPEAEDAVREVVQDREDKLADLFAASNYNDIAPQWGTETIIHGTPALWCSASHLTQPIYMEAVQPHELYITPGHMGVLDRFREQLVMAELLPVILKDYPVNLTEPSLAAKIAKPGITVRLMWGFWIDWSDPGNPQWRCEITVDGKSVMRPIVLGPMAGACPLLVGRFNPRPGRPWGRGSGIVATADFRVHDALRRIVLDGLDQSLQNTLIYADDGMIDLSEGIVPGRAHPASRSFTREQIYELNRQVNVEQGWLTEDRLIDELRAIFFQDGPRQRGETPPTAAQWLDERRRVQQRIGKPSAPLWTELLVPLIQRVEYLGVQLGRLPDAITHDGQTIAVIPISPLQKAQNQDDVMTTQANLQMFASMLADQTGTVINFLATGKNVARASGDKLIVFQEQQVQPDAAAAPAQ